MTQRYDLNSEAIYLVLYSITLPLFQRPTMV